MSRKLSQFLAIAVLAGALSACKGGNTLPIEAESLKENLSILEAAGSQWRPDAYLFQVDVELISGNSQRSAIAAGFQSPTEESESLLVIINQDGTVQTQRIDHRVPVRQVEPITVDDWGLDTAEALESALSDEGRRYLQENADSQCSQMTLHRDLQRPREPVEWTLSLGGCLLDGLFQRTAIDPFTGEVLSRENFP